MKMILKKGVLIVIEGIDGAGKSTQAEILLDRLKAKGYEVAYFQEPSESKWGREIKKRALFPDSLSPDEELDLFLKDRRENVERNLKPALKEGKIVILDRYYYSTIAYQGAKGIDKEMIRKANEEFVVKPDLVFVLDIDAKRGLERIQDRKNKDKLFEREDYLVKVRKIFRNFKGENIVHIDALKPRDEISEEIEESILKYLHTFETNGVRLS
ncbi:MAG: dTMP kinase [Candidatus Aminicenantes bacterium]|nr:MAG: dTMP kinase [Candidatus Aminicenantes bacterium]